MVIKIKQNIYIYIYIYIYVTYWPLTTEWCGFYKWDTAMSSGKQKMAEMNHMDCCGKKNVWVSENYIMTEVLWPPAVSQSE